MVWWHQVTSRYWTHWGQMTHICVSKLSIIGSDNGLSSGRPQAILWTNAGILLIGSLGTNFSEIFSEILTFSLKKSHLNIPSKWHLFCLSLNELNQYVDPNLCRHTAPLDYSELHSQFCDTNMLSHLQPDELPNVYRMPSPIRVKTEDDDVIETELHRIPSPVPQPDEKLDINQVRLCVRFHSDSIIF